MSEHKQIEDQPALIPGGFSFEVTHEQLGEVLGLGHSMIAKLRDEGMPQVRRGVYDLRECVQWYIDKWRRKDPEGGTEQTTRAALNVAQREKVELETQRARGELLPLATVRRVFQAFATAIASRLEGLPASGAAVLADMDTEPEVRAWLVDECHGIRAQLAGIVRELPGVVLEDAKPEAPKPARKKAARKKTTRKKAAAKAAR